MTEYTHRVGAYDARGLPILLVIEPVSEPDTAEVPPDVRHTTTTRTKGELKLRYTPKAPKREDGKTDGCNQKNDNMV